MQTRVQCPACKASFEVPAVLAGRDGECSQCRQVFRLKPLSGEVDSSVLSNGDSSATLEMPIVAEGRASADTDEFEIPDSSAISLEATDSELRTPNTPELEISELKQPELDVPAPSGSSPSPKKRKAKKVRRKKSVRKKTATKRRGESVLTEGDSRATSDHDLEVGEVQVFDDVQHDDDGAGLSSSPIILRRSGSFPATGKSTIDKSPTGKSPGKNSGRSLATVSRKHEKRKKLIMIVGGAVGLLLLFTAFSYLTSGPPVIMPTAQSGAGRSGGTQPSGSAPVPNQGGDSIQTGDTTSSVERANRIRTAPGLPRHPDDAADGAKGGTVDAQLSGNRTIVASSVDAQEIVPDSVSAGNFQTADDKLFSIDTVEIPTFPEPGRRRASTVSGVVFYEIAIVGLDQEKTRDDDSLPGSRMHMILYLPSATHARGSLPCVMIAAAGTTLLEGNGCYDESYQSETIPYVKQGFAVLGYSLDGPIASDDPSKMESKAAYDRFRAAHAGLVNSRNAMEFLLQKVPAINHERIFTAGHSSAGTLSLLFAEHESRLAGCIAYAPCIDVEKRLSEYIANPLVEILMSEVDQFVRQGSPQRHLRSLKCPVFLFHAEGDTNVPFAESREFAERLNAQGTPCKLESVPDGDHYSSMLVDGIPRGISWLKDTAMQTSPVSSSPSGPGPQ